jgi:hypothetical protein
MGVHGWWPLLLLIAIVTGAAFSLARQDNLLQLAEQIGLNEPQVASGAPGGVHVYIDSNPSEAEIRVDGIRRGQTPTQVSLSTGTHSVVVRQAGAVEAVRTVEVPESGTTLSVELWRREPQVAPIRPVVPGSTLTDARVVLNGDVVLTTNFQAASTASPASEAPQTYRLEPATAKLVPVAPAFGAASEITAVSLAPDGRAVATAFNSTPLTNSLWPASPPSQQAPGNRPTARVTVSGVDGTGTHAVLDVARIPNTPGTEGERITGLIWATDSTRLVAVSRVPGTPARARIFLIDPAAEMAGDSTELALLPAEVLASSATVDPSGHWLAFLAQTTKSANTNLSLCVVELRAGGVFRDIAEAGLPASLPAVAPLAWAPSEAASDSARLAYTAPVTGVASSAATGLLDIFGTLRPAAAPAGLFVVDLGVDGSAAQPRRIGTVTGLSAPVWRDSATIYGFVRLDDGALGLQSVDVEKGSASDTGARIKSGVVQGTGLAARWDVAHGRAALLTQQKPPAAGLQAWLVSFLPVSEVLP